MIEKGMPLNHASLLIEDAENAKNDLHPSLPALALDIHILEALVGDDPDLIKDFLREFRSSLATIAEAIRTEFNAEQIIKVGLKAHTLKSSARSMGALRLGDLCDNIESISKSSQSISALSEYFKLFNTEVTNVEIALQNLLGEK
jgi:HPt (histidine-containing phosphotransfer) domain-containing protein